MGDVNWDKLAEQAGSQTDEVFNKQLSSLINVNVSEIDVFIKESNITNQNALKVLKEINDVTKSNNQKVSTISKIENGFGFILKLASKVVV